jgi:hypothetical protein
MPRNVDASVWFRAWRPGRGGWAIFWLHPRNRDRHVGPGNHAIGRPERRDPGCRGTGVTAGRWAPRILCPAWAANVRNTSPFRHRTASRPRWRHFTTLSSRSSDSGFRVSGAGFQAATRRGGAPAQTADYKAHQRLTAARKDKAPAGSRGADQGCAGRRGDGGWGEPARHMFNVRSSSGFRALGGFLSRLGMRAKPDRAAQPAAPRSTAWVVRSGAKSSTPSMSRICASRARARCTRLLIVPTRQPQISAASS